MRNKIVLTIMFISLGVNVFLLGKWFLFERGYHPNQEETIILSEMVHKTIQSEEYEELSKKEKVMAIDANMDKNKGGVFPYYFGVSVRTDQQTYLFSCSDEECLTMEMGGTTYSLYEDEEPRLPFAVEQKN
ncbi:hypothetical protein QTG56_11270 [Rossellomorea sp. AcN35-11]|nr:hypothetical protein [Rossellomorea aquimaris]NMH67950.1 hypothetical protein [Bacillus sp. RO3]WJV31445.1 hypothetical protein QTG56_11270 [Rossellomorea sp. AcN35-11]